MSSIPPPVAAARASDAEHMREAVARLAQTSEELVFFDSEADGLHVILCRHDSTLGPTLGVTISARYPDRHAALADALLHARDATYQAALANVPFGGAAAVIVEPPSGHRDRERVFRAFGRWLNTLGGRFHTFGGAGCTEGDMNAAGEESDHVMGVSGKRPEGWAPGRYTALGVVRAMEAAMESFLDVPLFEGLVVSVQGAGRVGHALMAELADRGAVLQVADRDPARVEQCVARFGAVAMTDAEMVEAPCDIFAPCAPLRVLDAEVAARLRCRVIAGATMNPTHEAPGIYRALARREILYLPDYVVAAGGLLSNACEWYGFSVAYATIMVNGIYDTVQRIVSLAKRWDLSPVAVSERLAQEKLEAAHARRAAPDGAKGARTGPSERE